jgi:CRISPR-associated endoribonuclease Cas6
MDELISLVLTLRPVEIPPVEQTPLWWGRAAHALLLNVVRARDEMLAATLHDSASAENVSRPFTASTLMGRFKRGALAADETYTLRLTAYRADVAGILRAEALSGLLAAGQKVELDYVPFEVVSGQCDGDGLGAGWAAWTGYEALSARFLVAKREPLRRIGFKFTSPMTFRSHGKHVPLPLPELVFGSLLERWNAFAPVTFPPEARQYAAECLALSRFDLQTRPVPVKNGAMRVGAVGEATFVSVNFDRYWMSVLACLAAFSRFAGVGAGTTQGMGQARMVDE